MNLPTWYDAGTVSVATGSAIVTGFNNFWGDDAIMAGDLFCDPSQPLIPPQRVKSAKLGELELWTGWPGAPLVRAAYEVRYVGIIERSTAQTRKVLEELGQVNAWYDVIVEDDAARLALETASSPLRANYRVLVRTPGVIWAKKSGAFGDWIGPVEFRGPIGERGPVGPIGVTWRFAYDAGTTYAINDGVSLNGSSFRKRTAAPAGTAPSSASPPVHTADWEVLASKGKDGTGTGDMVGPSSSQAGYIVAFADEAGKLTKLGGRLPSFVEGLTMSNNALDSNNDIDIATGVAFGGGLYVANDLILTKQLDAAWAEGTNKGGLDTGSKALGATYHYHAIRKNSDGAFDCLISLSATAPAVPAGWARVQRLGAVLTNASSSIQGFIQRGKQFTLLSPILVISSTATRAAAPLAVITPRGVGTFALLNLKPIAVAGNVLVMQGDDFDARALGALYQSFEIVAAANSSGQISLAVIGAPNATTSWELSSRGWIDYSLAKIGA